MQISWAFSVLHDSPEYSQWCCLTEGEGEAQKQSFGRQLHVFHPAEVLKGGVETWRSQAWAFILKFVL